MKFKKRESEKKTQLKNYQDNDKQKEKKNRTDFSWEFVLSLH